jgi:hypothetical protein
MVMFAKTKRLVAVGVTAAAMGWVTVTSLGAAHSQPPPIPQGDNVTCPDIAGINYVRDPEDPHGFYLCVDGLVRHHYQCPPVTVLVMGIPPKCVPFRPVRP